MKLDPFLYTTISQSLFPHGCNENMSSCGFKGLVSSSCGSSKYQKQPSESIILLNCCKDIKGHLNGLNTFDSDLKSEAKLILARAGKSLKIITINMFLSEV